MASVTVNPVLLTILGFVVGLALSFRSSSAYERSVKISSLKEQEILI
jgi:predicted membrane chloride channel (bestrophin family)